jgi:hypothetical protein
MKLKKHLTDIRTRLEDEAGFIVEVVLLRNKREPFIGFFALTRMIMPIIETVARTEGLTGEELLAKLDIPSPKLTWMLYRNVFMHNDEFQFGRVGNRVIPTGLLITSAEQESRLGTVLKQSTFLDVGALYRRTIKYLDDRIAETPPHQKVDYISGIWFPESRGLAKKIQLELDEHDRRAAN